VEQVLGTGLHGSPQGGWGRAAISPLRP